MGKNMNIYTLHMYIQTAHISYHNHHLQYFPNTLYLYECSAVAAYTAASRFHIFIAKKADMKILHGYLNLHACKVCINFTTRMFSFKSREHLNNWHCTSFPFPFASSVLLAFSSVMYCHSLLLTKRNVLFIVVIKKKH